MVVVAPGVVSRRFLTFSLLKLSFGFFGLFLKNNSMPESIILFLRMSGDVLFLFESEWTLISGVCNNIGFWSQAGNI